MTTGVRERSDRIRAFFDATTSVAILGTCAVMLWAILHREPGVKAGAQPLPSQPQSLVGLHKKGNDSAPVAVIQYSEFECPFCATFHREIWPALEREYVDTGKVQFAFRHFPLQRLHPFAYSASEAAECAGRQGQFWGMHDLLLAGETRLREGDHSDRARQLRLDVPRFERCLAGEASAAVAEDVEAGRRAGVASTPTFLIGRVTADRTVQVSYRIRGAKPIAEFRAALTALLR